MDARDWRRLTLEVGAGAKEPAVTDDNTPRVENRAFVELNRDSAITGKQPGDALGDDPYTAGLRGVHQVGRPLTSHSVVGRCVREDVSGIIRQIGQLVDHHVRVEPVHDLEQRVAIENITDDRFGTGLSQPIGLARSAGHSRHVVALADE